jgi:hypothetical protein
MILEDIEIYDGKLLHNRFAYQFHRNSVCSTGNIVAFRAPMKVEVEGMIDTEDILANDFIYSEDAINFLWEIPGLDPFGAVAFQRLLNTHISHLIYKRLQCPIEVDGDDIIVHKEHDQGGIVQPKGKCSVSITYCKNGAALGHTGINITAGDKAPAHAFSTKIEDPSAFMAEVNEAFYGITRDIFVATTKCYAHD